MSNYPNQEATMQDEYPTPEQLAALQHASVTVLPSPITLPKWQEFARKMYPTATIGPDRTGELDLGGWVAVSEPAMLDTVTEDSEVFGVWQNENDAWLTVPTPENDSHQLVWNTSK